jgi:hypothetical protein
MKPRINFTLSLIVILLPLVFSEPVQAKEVVKVLPQKTEIVKVSNQHINWMRCLEGNMEDIIYSEEKGVKAWIKKESAYVKFMMKTQYGKTFYAKDPLDIYVYCAGDTYKLILKPTNELPQGQTIHLGSEKAAGAAKNRSLYKSKPTEENALMMIKAAYLNLVEEYQEERLKDSPRVIDNMELLSIRSLRMLGLGLVLKEYQLHNPSDKKREIDLKALSIERITSNPVAMSADPLIIAPNENAKIWIVEKEKGQIPLLFKEP